MGKQQLFHGLNEHLTGYTGYTALLGHIHIYDIIC